MTVEAPRPASAKRCRYCREGRVPNKRGRHWIVESIIPSRMSIRKCEDFVPAPPESAAGEPEA